MKRTRQLQDGTAVEFRLKTFDQKGPIRAEIAVADEKELRELMRRGKLIALRMEGPSAPGSNKMQVNLVPWGQIEDFDWNA